MPTRLILAPALRISGLPTALNHNMAKVLKVYYAYYKTAGMPFKLSHRDHHCTTQ
jgi:hypothetical protein